MSCPIVEIPVTFVANQTNELLARATARLGTGAATGVSGEGNWLVQANVTSITRYIYDLTTDPDEASPTTDSITVSSAIVDTPVTSTAVWTKDSIGYNFVDPVTYTKITEPGHKYKVEYQLVLAAGLGSARGLIRFVGEAV